MKIQDDLSLQGLQQFWKVSAEKIQLIRKEYDTSKGAPVFTEAGKYTTRGGPNGLRGSSLAAIFYSLVPQMNTNPLIWPAI